MRRIDAALGGAVALLVVYVLTLAPDVTFWDAGEFIAAARSLGIPHPPGTPLYILLIDAWATLLFFVPFALATNLFSAVATALAAFLSARLVARAHGDRATTIAAAIAAGAMSSVWLNATETEVYAASLALGVILVWSGERAGSAEDERSARRWTLLTVYLIALAVSLHLSALVAAPAAIALAAYRGGRMDWMRLALLGGALVAAAGVGRMSPWLALAGAVLMLLAAVRRGPSGGAVAAGGAAVAVSALGASALAFLYLRAQLDPAINQGDPSTWRAFVEMVARRQYDVAPMWPRKAPVWIQLGNLGQYADWQAALSLGPTVMPSLLRTAFTALLIGLGYVGVGEQWRVSRRAFVGTLVLFVCGTLGVLVYLNLHAGPSIGWGIIAANVPREARERDYFFVFGFWAWGLWAGIGAVALARRYARPAWAGVIVAALPIALNWRAINRRAEPEASLPATFAEAILESAPRDALLFVVGDNDSYPLWYAQQVKGIRRDVVPLTIPLLPTRWYRQQLVSRYRLIPSAEARRYDGRMEVASRYARGARERGRPVAATILLPVRDRALLLPGESWRASGLVYVAGAGGAVDTVVTRRVAERVRDRLGERRPREAIDPVHSYFRRVLDCPRALLSGGIQADSSRLDSVCNYR